MNHSIPTGWQDALGRLPLVAILRGITPDECEGIGDALWHAGFRLLEVPLNSPDPIQSITRLARRFPQAIVGAGTVRTADEVRQVHAAGGRLVISPHFEATVVRGAVLHGMIALPGVATPTEAFAALAAGASGLKLFPAETIPPAAVKALRSVLPAGTLLFPVGGMVPALLADYRAAGADGFGIGSALFRPGMDAAAVAASARAFADAWAGTMRA